MKVYGGKRSRTVPEPNAILVDEDIDGPRKRIKQAATTSRKAPKLTQTTIDLGGPKIKRCSVCEMEYMVANEEDVRAHRQYHTLSTATFTIPTKLQSSVEFSRPGDLSTDRIIQVSSSDAAPIRKIAFRVLEVAERELGAIKTLEAELWGRVKARPGATVGPLQPCSSNARTGRPSKLTSRNKILLYVRGRACIGLCLVKQISSARQVISSQPAESKMPMELSEQQRPADIGISRIWTSKTHRRKGMASRLLDASLVLKPCGDTLPKDRVAFSQPTTSGAALARRWHGRDHGWLVFDENTNMSHGGAEF